MFDSAELAGWTTQQLLRAVSDNHEALREAECRQLLLAAAWADDQDRDRTEQYPAQVQRSTIEGGSGRSVIDEDAVAEFGALIGVGMVSARNLISDAVRLRWHYPQVWALVQAAGVPAWQARKLVQFTTDLSWDQTAELDTRLAGIIGTVPWPRFERILLAAVLDVDPEGVRARELRARTERFVRAHDGGDGLKLLVARATSGDACWFMAAVNRIAEVLGEDGDNDSVDVRRSRAIGILGQPARALQLIASHAQAGRSGEPEPVATEDDETGRPLPDNDPVLIAEREHETVPGWAQAPAGPLLDIDPRVLRPRVVLHFHLSDAAFSKAGALVRPEHGGPLSLDQLRDFLADTGCHVTVRPVVMPAHEAPVDCYEIPGRLRSAVRLRNLVDVFPYGSSEQRELDLDHTVPYRSGGPPRQTGLHNLGPLSRSAHRAATPRIGKSGRITGRWRKRQPSPGVFVWRSPHGYVYLTTNRGTLPLGAGTFGTEVWRQAVRTPLPEMSPAAA